MRLCYVRTHLFEGTCQFSGLSLLLILNVLECYVNQNYIEYMYVKLSSAHSFPCIQ